MRAAIGRHNREGLQTVLVGILRQLPQDGIDRRFGQERYSTDDARNAVLVRFRRVELVRPDVGRARMIRVSSLAFRQSGVPILSAPSQRHDKDEAATKGFEGERKPSL